MSFSMRDEDLKLLADFIKEYCGLSFSGSQSILFKKRVEARIKEKGFKSKKEYYRYLKYDRKGEEELKNLIDILTVNETYFMREKKQFDVLKRHILPELKEEKKKGISKSLKIWSAACSNGAEPYSIAICVYESDLFPKHENWRINILGTDISTAMLSQAKEGVYQTTYFRNCDKRFIKTYFDKLDGAFRIKDHIKRMVTFGYLNLTNERQVLSLRSNDIVFLRNVLIYFNNDVKKKVVELIYKTMVPGGYLFIGQSESLFKVTNLFELKSFSGVLLYQKPKE